MLSFFFFLAGFFCGGTHRAHEIDTGSYPGTPLFLLGAWFTEQVVIRAPSQERASTTAEATLALRCTPRHPYMGCVCVCKCLFLLMSYLRYQIVFLKKTLPHLEYNIIGRLIAWWVVGNNNASPKKRVCSTCHSRSGKRRSHERSRAGFAMSCSWMGTLVLPFPAV